MNVRRVVIVLALALLASGLGGCRTSDLAFVADHRLEFAAPASRELVTQPVALRWRIEDFDVAPPGNDPPSDRRGYFAIFVDRAPVGPGETLRDVAGSDKDCRRTPGCPDERYLADRGVYTTSETTFTLGTIPDLDNNQRVQLHEATVILLDSRGRRIGESAWHVAFRLRRIG